MMNRNISRENWIDQFDSASARKNANSGILQFDNFLAKNKLNEMELFEFLRKSDEVETYFILRDIVRFLQEHMAFGTAKLYYNYIKSWFVENRIEFNDKTSHKYVKWRRPLKERKYTPSIEIINQILGASTRKYRSFWLFLASTGCRQGEVMQLQVKDFDRNENPIKFLIRAETTKTRQERINFVTKETWDAIKYRFENKKPNDLVFGDISVSNLHAQMERIRQTLNLTDRYSTGIHKMTPHRFRAFVKKSISRVTGDNHAHFVLGHTEANDTYDGDNDEGVKDDFLKAEKVLTLDLGNKLKDEKRRQDTLEERVKQLEEQLRRNATK